jgi:hypothetical protein
VGFSMDGHPLNEFSGLRRSSETSSGKPDGR